MAANSTTKAERLYNQCRKAYEKCRKRTGSTRNGMPDPGMFNDEYNIPAELLFEELRKSNNKWDKERHVFSWRLLEWIYEKRQWNLNLFSEMRKSHFRKINILFIWNSSTNAKTISVDLLLNQSLSMKSK